MSDLEPALPAIEASPIIKQPTGIGGFDAISGGGLPRHRLTVVVGESGAGKTIFAMQTVAARLAAGEACIFVAFEEPADRVLGNVASFDWGGAMCSAPNFHLLEARMPLNTIIDGAFDLSGLLAGLSAIKEEMNASLVVFDAIDALLADLRDENLERRELARIHDWIREAAISAILTVKSFGAATREERRSERLQYMADCVVTLSRTVTDTESSRTLCVEKYRGADFAANPAPMVISAHGLEVIAIDGARPDYPISNERVSTGVVRLDGVMDGGYRRGSSVLVSGSPGTSKTTLAVSFVAAACARGERALFVSFDENGVQIIQNVKSLGIELAPYVDSGLLKMASFVSTGRSPEEHFLRIRGLLDTHRPQCLVIDPISSLLKSGYPFSRAICESMLDNAKSQGISVLCTSLLEQVSGDIEMSASHVSTIADTWLHVSYIARDGERNRALTIIKSRGMAHSNQVRELVMSAGGVDLVDVYVAEGEVLMGSARVQKEAEVARLEAIQDGESRLRRMEMEAEIEDLAQKVSTVTLALEAKRREVEFIDRAEEERAQARSAAAELRLELRRSASEARIAGHPRDQGIAGEAP